MGLLMTLIESIVLMFCITEMLRPIIEVLLKSSVVMIILFIFIL